MSSLMADFDMIIELSNPALLNLIKSKVQFSGQSLNPPFEVEIPIFGGGITSEAHMIVDGITLDLNAGDTIGLNFVFSSASVSSVSVDVISGLDGDFTVTAPVVLGGPGGNPSVGVDFANANVVLNFTPVSITRITNALNALPIPISPDRFRDIARQALQDFIRELGLYLLPLQFPVVAGQDGNLSPLSFVRLEVHCIPHQDRNRQALAIFGILLVANNPRGNFRTKTETTIPSGQDVCVSLSPEAFHSLLFCRQLAATVSGGNVYQLPPTCGSFLYFIMGGVTFGYLSDTFSNGHIDINASFAKSGFCYKATGSVHGRLTIRVAGNRLTPNFTPDMPITEVDTPWYCDVVSFVLLGPISAVVSVIVEDMAENIAQNLAESMVSGFGDLLPSINIPSVAGGVTFQTVSITPEGLTICGTLPPISLPPPRRRWIGLSRSIITLNRRVINSGRFLGDPCSPDGVSPSGRIPSTYGEYPYEEVQSEQKGSYEAILPSLLGRPLSYEWWLTSGNTRVDLPGPRGTASIVVGAHFPFPLVGGTVVTKEVQIGYIIDENRIELTNTPTDGSYTVTLHVRATDPSGRSVDAYSSVSFTGHTVYIGGHYEENASRCMRETWRRDKRPRGIKEPFGLPPIPPPDASLEEILGFVYEASKADPGISDYLLSYTTLAFGGKAGVVWESPEVWSNWLKNRRTGQRT